LFSNFDSIRVPVSEGRRLFVNIQRFNIHLLAVNAAEAVVLILGLSFQDVERRSVFPFSPIAVPWINMVRRRFLYISLEPNSNNLVSTHSS
jgi:magnesium-transporting ATPase (P-type)